MANLLTRMFFGTDTRNKEIAEETVRQILRDTPWYRELQEIKSYCEHKIDSVPSQALTDVYTTIKRLCEVIG